MKKIYANSKDSLRVKALGLNHDHCYWYYFGSINNLPKKYKHFYKKDYKYIFLYKEGSVKY